ncbi:MAG: hypothetical protein ACFFC7_26400 [Candidatus Hermodarchaeota archaeon]
MKRIKKDPKWILLGIIFCSLLIFTSSFQLMVETEKVEACNVHRTLGSAHVGHFTDSESLQIVYGGDGTLRCMDALTGTQIWEWEYANPEDLTLYSDNGPYWFWHPIKTSAESELYDLLIWNRTEEYPWQWEIYDGVTLEKLVRIPQPHWNLGGVKIKDLDADGVEEAIFEGAWWSSGPQLIYDPNREPQTIWGNSTVERGSIVDMDGDGQYEWVVIVKNETNWEIEVLDWQNNWNLIEQFIHPYRAIDMGDYDRVAMLTWGNYTGAPVLETVFQHGSYNKPHFFKLYNQTGLIWNFTLTSRGELKSWRIDRDLDGDGSLEWIFFWDDLSSAEIPEGVHASGDFPSFLTVVCPKERKTWWTVPFEIGNIFLRSHGRFHKGYFDKCFGDFTEDGIKDLVLRGKENLCVVDGATGNLLKEYSYADYLIPHIEVCDINQNQVPEILLMDFLPEATNPGIYTYALHLIYDTTNEIRSISPPRPLSPEDQFALGFLLGSLPVALGLLGIFIILVRKIRAVH